MSRVSLLATNPDGFAQYVRSAGTAARLMYFDWSNHTASIRLPSGVIRDFSIYTTVVVGGVALVNKRLLKNNKAGASVTRGLKPLTRGVAKNPVDHPHGGRTKAIRYPRTP